MKFKETLNKNGIEMFGEREELLEKEIEEFDAFDLELVKEIAEDQE